MRQFSVTNLAFFVSFLSNILHLFVSLETDLELNLSPVYSVKIPQKLSQFLSHGKHDIEYTSFSSPALKMVALNEMSGGGEKL